MLITRSFVLSLSFAILGASVVGCSGQGPQAPGSAPQAVAADGADAGPAQPGSPGHPGHGHHGHHAPPPASYEACQAKAAGDACTLTFGEKSIGGKCVTPPAGAPDARAFCMPVPPPAVYDACTSKAAGDACSVTMGDKTWSGKCSAPPPEAVAKGADARLGCRPEGHFGGPRGPHEGGHHGPPPEAFTACDGKTADAACSVKMGERTFDGTCRTPPPGSDEKRLACGPKHDGKHDGPPPPKP